MSNPFSKMYRQKVKKPRDPNLPPRPTLLGHDKTIRGIQSDAVVAKELVQRQEAEIAQLKEKLRITNHRLDMLTDYIRNNKK